MRINWYILGLALLITASGAGSTALEGGESSGSVYLLGSIFGAYLCMWAMLWAGGRISGIFRKKDRAGNG